MAARSEGASIGWNRPALKAILIKSWPWPSMADVYALEWADTKIRKKSFFSLIKARNCKNVQKVGSFPAILLPPRKREGDRPRLPHVRST